MESLQACSPYLGLVRGLARRAEALKSGLFKLPVDGGCGGYRMGDSRDLQGRGSKEAHLGLGLLDGKVQ